MPTLGHRLGRTLAADHWLVILGSGGADVVPIVLLQLLLSCRSFVELDQVEAVRRLGARGQCWRIRILGINGIRHIVVGGVDPTTIIGRAIATLFTLIISSCKYIYVS